MMMMCDVPSVMILFDIVCDILMTRVLMNINYYDIIVVVIYFIINEIEMMMK